MNAEAQREVKKALRARIRALRDALGPEERERLGAAIRDRLFEAPGRAEARCVMVFSSFGSEVPTGPIIERLAAGDRTVALPRVAGRDMEAVAYRPGDPMALASFGAMEPVEGTLVPAEAIDVVIAPGLAFDRVGYRLGYGGGHFDRFLQRVRRDALRLAICFDLQVVDEVPREPWDQPVDMIFTDRETITCGSAGRA